MKLQTIPTGIKAFAGAVARWVSSELKDPAVRRAILLGSAAYLIRKAPFLDESSAEGLSDKALLGVGYLLSKMPGSRELAAQSDRER